MPFKDKEKERVYKKGYMEMYFKKNRDSWNDYQKKAIKNKRSEEKDRAIKEAHKIALELGFDEKSPSRLAMIVFAYTLLTGIKKPFYISKNLNEPIDDVKKVFENWKKSGHWDGKNFIIEQTRTELEEMIQFTMIAMVGGGQLACVRY